MTTKRICFFRLFTNGKWLNLNAIRADDGTREHFKLHWLRVFDELHAVSVDLRARSILSTLIWYCTRESFTLNIPNSHAENKDGKFGHTRSQ